MIISDRVSRVKVLELEISYYSVVGLSCEANQPCMVVVGEIETFGEPVWLFSSLRYT